MRTIAHLLVLLLGVPLGAGCATDAPAPPDLHRPADAAHVQIAQLFAPDDAVADAVAAALRASALRVVRTEGRTPWGRVTAVDADGDEYVLSWERSTLSSDGTVRGTCVLLFVSSTSFRPAVALGDLAESVRRLAESG